MQTVQASQALRDIMSHKGVTVASIYRSMEANEPGMPRQKAYDRVRAVNPKLKSLASVLDYLGYSIVLVPNEKVGRLTDDCYRIVEP